MFDILINYLSIYLYKELKNTEMQVKVGDVADELNERIEGEASAARRVLTSVTRNTRPVSPPSYSSNSNTSLPQRKVDSGVIVERNIYELRGCNCNVCSI